MLMRLFISFLVAAWCIGVSASSTLLAQAEKKADEKPVVVERPKDKSPDALLERIEAIEKYLEDKMGLSIFGFFDIYAANYTHAPNAVNFSFFELGIIQMFPKFFEVNIAMDVTKDGAFMSVMYHDCNFLRTARSRPGPGTEAPGIHLRAGKSDVPFGADWLSYPTNTRLTVSQPLFTQVGRNGGLNDVGGWFYAHVPWLSLYAYVLRGEGKGNAYGGRLGFLPFRNPYTFKQNAFPDIEIGLSHIRDVDRGWHVQSRDYAIDLKLSAGPVLFTAEYNLFDRKFMRNYEARFRFSSDVTSFIDSFADLETMFQTNFDTRLREVDDGGQVTLGFNLAYFGPPVTIYGRYDFWRQRKNDPFAIFAARGQLATRAAVGLNIRVLQAAIIKLEYYRYLDTWSVFRERSDYTRNSYFAQVVALW